MSESPASLRHWRDELPIEQEWPTWLLIAAVYASWLAVVAHARELGFWTTAALLALVTCWYGSLQHELLHGHPTRSARLNRLLGLAPLAVWFPYDLYRDSHLRHHRDPQLTLPGEAPESNYVTERGWRTLATPLRWVYLARRTLLGRALVAGRRVPPQWRGVPTGLIVASSQQDRVILDAPGIDRFVPCHWRDYRTILSLEASARQHGYPELA